MATNNYVILDTETNGIGTFRPARQRVIQWSWITSDGEERNYFVKNGVDAISPSVPHDITLATLSNHGTEFDIIYSQFKKDLSKFKTVIAHNAIFDMGCIRNELKLRNYPSEEIEKFRSIPVFCTMNKTVKYCAIPMKNKEGKLYKNYKWPRLDELYFKLFNSEPDAKLHDSLEDCKVLKQCYDECMKRQLFK